MRQDTGFSILTTIFVLVVLSALGLGALEVITGSSQMSVDEYRSQRAFDVAQAGLQYTAQQLVGDTDWSDNVGETKSFGPGSFTTSYLSQTASTASVQSDSTVGGITRSVSQEMRVNPGSSAAFDDALYSEGDIDLINNTNITIDGDITTGGSVNTSGGSDYTATGTITESHAAADVPEPDWAYWKGIADYDITGDYSFADGVHNGIYYITGRAKIQGVSDFTLNGTIISREEVHVTNSSNVNLVAQNTNPAIIAEGAIHLDNTLNIFIYGWVISLDSIHVNNVSTLAIEGGVASSGEIKLNNDSNVTVTYDPDRVPSAGFSGGESGGSGGSGGSIVLMGTWREVF